MGMTMTQKILAKHAGLESVRAGQLIQAKLDLVLGNDITTPVAINEFESAGFEKVFDKSRIAMVMDHFAPNKDIKSAEQAKIVRDFDLSRIEHLVGDLANGLDGDGGRDVVGEHQIQIAFDQLAWLHLIQPRMGGENLLRHGHGTSQGMLLCVR